MKIDPENLESSGFIHPTLTRILHVIEAQTGLEFMTTSMFRPNGEGVHSVTPLRGWVSSKIGQIHF